MCTFNYRRSTERKCQLPVFTLASTCEVVRVSLLYVRAFVCAFLPRACNPYETTDTLGGVLRPVPFDLCDLRRASPPPGTKVRSIFRRRAVE